MFNTNNSCVFYVSQLKGNDKANGLSPIFDNVNAPFKTIEHAVTTIKALRKENNFKPFIISLVDDYYLETPLTIDTDLITLESFNGRKKIIGGIKLENFEKDIFNGIECYSAKLPETNLEFSDFWADDRRATLPRFPKSEELLPIEVENDIYSAKDNNANEDAVVKLDTHQTWFIADTKALNHIPNIEKATINYYHWWIDEHSPIESYDSSSGKLVMKYPSRFFMSADPESGANVRYYLSNHPTFFSDENEWYIDSDTNKLYYIGDIKAGYLPTLTHLIKIIGNNVRIQNIELLCTKGDYISTGEENDRSVKNIYASDIQSVCWASGAVIFENSKGSSIENCYLHSVGLHGIEIKKGCKNIRIVNNKISDIGAGGIKIFGGAYEENSSLLTTNCEICNNEISNCSKRYEAGCGILVNHSANNKITNNHIHHIGYTGISVGWVWGYNESSSYGNIIEKNHIHHIGRGKISDLGGIYLLGKQPGTIVSENRIHNIKCAKYGGWGIYTDQGSSYIVIENNVVFFTQSYSFNQNFGNENIVKNNIFAFGDGVTHIHNREELHNILFENNIFITDGTPIYGAKEPNYDGFYTFNSSKNILWDISGETKIFNNIDLKEWQEKYGKDLGSIIADPLFKNVKEFDFSLNPDSPAIKAGFKPLDGFIATGK